MCINELKHETKNMNLENNLYIALCFAFPNT